MREELRPGLAGRHPLLVFLLTLASLSVLLQLTWANAAGGWARWGDDILWYRLSCVLDDVILAAGAYAIARLWAGPLWWRKGEKGVWAAFVAVCAGGGIFLMVLTRRLAALYGPDVPPLADGWLPVWQRSWLPFLLLLWVRRRWLAVGPWLRRQAR